MSSEIRTRMAGWAAAMTALAVCAVLPETVKQAVGGRIEPKIAWFTLAGFFGLVAWLVEGLDIGRQTRHRKSIDDQIVKAVVEAACTNGTCPEADSPGPQTRVQALTLFYELVDERSREVAFRNWGWYYTSVQGLWISSIALACAFVGAVLKPVDHEIYRGLAFICIVVALLGADWVATVWTRKTHDHMLSQLIQIRPNLARRNVGAACVLGAWCLSR
jgi:hypothetical protein